MPTPSLPLQTRLARIDTPSSAAVDGLIGLTWSTGAEVRRYDLWADQPFLESLDLAGADLTRLNAGAPVLDSHQNYGLAHVIGVVERAWVEDNLGRAEIRLSQRPEVAGIRADIAAGILRNVSIGYAIHELERTPAATRGAPDLVRITRFEPLEISIVPVPADAGAQVRRDGTSATFPVTIVRSPEEQPMPEIQDAGPEDQPVLDTPTAEATPPDPNLGPDLATLRAQAIGEERARVAAITDLCGRVQQARRAPDYIAAGLDLEQVRAALLDVWAGDTGPAIRAGSSEEPPPPASAWKAVTAKINRSFAGTK